jgi:hypothetical protein
MTNEQNGPNLLELLLGVADSVWTGFTHIFCEVQAVCHDGRPNWFGWIVIVVLLMFISAIAD